MSYTVTFWGTRGSIPTPGARTARYGGNTPCVTLSHGDGHLVILDAGTGIRLLGSELMRVRGPLRADLFLSHTHWDHIQGLPFFKPLSVRGHEIVIRGAPQDGVALEEILRRQMDPMVFPVPLTALAAATVRVGDIGEGCYDVDHFTVQTFCLRHPGTTLGFRFRPRAGGPDVAYLTDNELGPGGRYAVAPDWRRRLVGFLRGTHTLIHDAMYSESIVGARGGWGHSTPRQAVDLAAEADVARLVLFHHDPDNDDETVDRLLQDARAHAAARAPGLTVEAAVEGWRLTL